MGRGRAPCCDKSQVKRGPWSPAEDLKLITFIQKHDHFNWRALPKLAGLHRCGKSCRLRWVNYLRPDVKRGDFTKEEEETIIRMHAEIGNKWSKIASQIPGRTDNDIKNLWNTHLKKRLQASTTTESGRDESKETSLTTSSLSSSDSSDSKNKDKNSPTHQVQEQASTKTGQDAARKDSLKQVSNENVVKTVELKELSGSEYSHTDVIDASLFVNYRSLQQITTKISSGVPLSINKISEEVNKPDISETKNVMEQPLESDFDFWGMLENIGSYQYKEAQLRDFITPQSSSFGEASCHEYENRKWFHHYVYDNELSLGTISSKYLKQDQFEANNAAEPIPKKQIVPKQEPNPGMVDFPIVWHSWTHKSSFIAKILS